MSSGAPDGRRTVPTKLVLDAPSLGLDVPDPPGDHGRIGAGLQSLAVPGQSGIAFGRGFPDRAEATFVLDRGGLGLGEPPARFLEPIGLEYSGHPAIQGRDDLLLLEVYGPGVVDVLGQHVLGGVAAPVVRTAVIPAALHPAVTQPASHEAAKQVGAPGSPVPCGRFPAGRSPSAGSGPPGTASVLMRGS